MQTRKQLHATVSMHREHTPEEGVVAQVPRAPKLPDSQIGMGQCHCACAAQQSRAVMAPSQ